MIPTTPLWDEHRPTTPFSKTKLKNSTSTIPYILIKSDPLFYITHIIHTTTLYILHNHLRSLSHTHTHSNTSYFSKIEQVSLLQKCDSSLLTKTRPPITLINYSSNLELFSFWVLIPSIDYELVHTHHTKSHIFSLTGTFPLSLIMTKKSSCLFWRLTLFLNTSWPPVVKV